MKQNQWQHSNSGKREQCRNKRYGKLHLFINVKEAVVLSTAPFVMLILLRRCMHQNNFLPL
jgi:hypothetical protein